MSDDLPVHSSPVWADRVRDDLAEIRETLARIERSQTDTQTVVESTIERVMTELQSVLPMINQITGNPMIARMLGIKK